MGFAQAETLQEAMVSAYQTNPSLKAERARVKETDENYIQARSQGRLNSSLSASIARQAFRAPSQGFFGPVSGRTIEDGQPRVLALQVIQPIYQGGRVKALKQQAKSGIFAAREGLRSAEQNLFVSVATAYVDVLRDEETARIRRNNVSVLARQEQAALDRFDVGEGTLTDIAQAQSRQAAANIGLAQADAQLASSRAAYERLVGHPPVDLQAVPDFTLPATLQEAREIGVANNPQLGASLFSVEAAKAGIKVAKSAGRPSFSINGALANQRAQLGGFRESDSASLTAQLNIPLYSGGANKSRVRQAKSTVERLNYEARDIENAIEQTVTQIWASLKAAEASLIAAKEQVRTAEVAFEGVTLEQQVGTRDTLDVLNAEQELLNAKLSVVNAERSVDVTSYQLLSILGGFDADSLQLPVDFYDPAANFEDVKRDSLTRAVDRYVPVAVRKIGRQLPNIPKDVAKFGKQTGIPANVKGLGAGVGTVLDGVGTLQKDAVDAITGQSGVVLPPPERELDDAPILLPALDGNISAQASSPDSPQN
jgi:outer membrane protein